MATLRDLGLSEYEARTYRALLTTGPTTAKELSKASDVPMGRIYDVLESLESAEMVRSQDASRPKKYAPVDPETALDRLLDDKRREFERELARYEQAVDDLVDQLDGSGPADRGFWTVAVGPEDSVELLIDRLSAATDSIVMVAAEPSPQFDLGRVGERIAAAIESALDRGVEVSVLASPGLVGAVPRDVRERYERLVVDADGFAVRTTANVSGTFNLIDRTEVCVGVPNPLDPDEALALIDLTDPTFAANLHREFDDRWADADPFP